MSANTCAITLS